MAHLIRNLNAKNVFLYRGNEWDWLWCSLTVTLPLLAPSSVFVSKQVLNTVWWMPFREVLCASSKWTMTVENSCRVSTAERCSWAVWSHVWWYNLRKSILMPSSIRIASMVLVRGSMMLLNHFKIAKVLLSSYGLSVSVLRAHLRIKHAVASSRLLDSGLSVVKGSGLEQETSFSLGSQCMRMFLRSGLHSSSNACSRFSPCPSTVSVCFSIRNWACFAEWHFPCPFSLPEPE